MGEDAPDRMAPAEAPPESTGTEEKPINLNSRKKNGWELYDTKETSLALYLKAMNPEGRGSKAVQKALIAEMGAALSSLADASAGLMELQEIPAIELETPFDEHLPLKIENNIPLKSRTLSRSIETQWGICSFSWLTRNISHGDKQAEPEKEDVSVSEDLISQMRQEVSVVPKTEERILPKGARTGSAIHEIFEEMDFAVAMENFTVKNAHMETIQIIETKLRKYGIINPAREAEFNELMDAACTIIRNVLQTPIPQAGNLILAHLPQSCRLDELEFYYPICGIAPESLAEVFRQHGVDGVGRSFRTFGQRIEQLNFNLREGVMHGFIDLLFKDQGKYYVLDWKSNWLGENHHAYTAKAIEESMVNSFYILQYHIYVLAVHLWLKSRSDSYCYAEDFGGVIYAYVRGMNPASPGNSIYFDRPGEDLIMALAAVLGLEA